MSWNNLEEDLANEFSTLQQVDPWEQPFISRTGRSEKKDSRALLAQARAAKAGPSSCVRTGCQNLLPPPGHLQPGPVPETCSPRCSNAVAYYRRRSTSRVRIPFHERGK